MSDSTPNQAPAPTSSSEPTPAVTPTPASAPNSAQTVAMTQAAFDAIIAERVARAQRTAQEAVLKAAGVGSLDELTAKLNAKPAEPVAAPPPAPDASGLDALKAEIAAMAAKLAESEKKATEAAAAAQRQRVETTFTALAQKAGVVDVPAALLLLRTEGALNDDADDAALLAAVEKLKASRPYLFSVVPANYRGVPSNGTKGNPDPLGDKEKAALQALTTLAQRGG